ncbi:MAG: hypothetical protein K0S00_4637 [Xanthobacteraceae bacterium]|jgi:hypothetical protein|nr:hypothetical protein [Xanthobacteraceae bacterium]
MRMKSTRTLATRTPLRLAPLLAGTALLASLAAAAPAAAQSADPWQGIKVLVTPPGDDPAYDDGQQAAAGAPAEAPAASTDVEADDSFQPSLWSSLDLGLGGATPEPESEAKETPPAWLLPGPAPKVKQGKLPTELELKQGYTSLSVTSNASASAPVSSALERNPGSGSGELKGRVGVGQDNLTLYGTGTVGASASGTTPSVYDSMAVGSTYSVPLAPLGMGDEKFGASVEVNNSQQLTTGVELRAPSGSYERFISVQRQVSPDSDPSGVVKAGVLGKF